MARASVYSVYSVVSFSLAYEGLLSAVCGLLSDFGIPLPGLQSVGGWGRIAVCLNIG